jgi:hypothetical protein
MRNMFFCSAQQKRAARKRLPAARKIFRLLFTTVSVPFKYLFLNQEEGETYFLARVPPPTAKTGATATLRYQ